MKNIRWAVLLVLAAAMGGAVAAQVAKPARVMEAEEIRLLDSKGNMRASLTIVDDGPGLALYDEAGKPRAFLALTKSGPALGFYDAGGKRRAAVVLDREGEPAVNLFDAAGRVVWSAP